MVFILNGNSEPMRKRDGKHVYSKNIFGFALKKCLKQIKLLISLNTSITYLSYNLI